MPTTTVGAVKYDATIDLASLKSSLSQADKLVEQSYKTQTKNAKKASSDITKTSSDDAQVRIDAVTKEAQATVKTISSYAPQVQKQFLTVERANNQVATATVAAQKAIQNYGAESGQAETASNRLKIAIQNQAQQQDKLNGLLDGSASKTSAFSDKLSKAGAVAGATAAIVATVLDKALSEISNSIDSAIKRVDTLNNAPKVLKNLGYSAVDSAKATQKLAKGIQGLPTSLDDATSALVSIASASGKSIDYATDLTLAFNNMALAGGKGPADASRALLQFTQALGRGSFQANDFNTLMEVMPAQLNQVAKTLLGPSANAQTLKEQLSDGTVTVNQFSDAVVNLDKKGGDGFASFSDQAKDATSGIGTSITNAQTAITRGITKIIDAIGASNISGAALAIGKSFEYVLDTIANVIEFVVGSGKKLGDWISKNETLVKNLGIVIATLLLPQIVAIGVQSTVAFAKYAVGLALATAQTTLASIRMAAAWLLALGPIGLIIAAVAGAVALIIANWDSVSKFVVGVWNTIRDAVAGAFDWVKNNWPLLLAIITGPFGLAVLAITKNLDKIKSVVGSVWDWIKGVFGTIGSVASNIIRIPVNAIIEFAENTINGFIRSINGMLGVINKLPGPDIGKLSTINIPKLADGGIIKARPGGVLANIAEGGEDEVVTPLSKLEKMMSNTTNNQNVTVNLSLTGVMTSSKSDERAIATRIAKLINEAVKSKTGSTAIVGI